MADFPSDHPLVQFVRSLELHIALSREAKAAILALPIRLRMVESSTYLTREGDRPESCGILASGYAYRQKETAEGQRQIVSLHIPGEALDLQHLYLSEADHSVQMLTRGEVGFVPRSDLQALASQHPEIGRAITIAILVEASIFREWVLNVGRRNARSRMAHLLCEFAIRLHAQGLFTEEPYVLPISQEQLADALGLTPVHVNRTLKSMEVSGLIRRNKREIAFPSWNTLRDVAGFNQRYLHLRSTDLVPGESVAPRPGLPST